MAVIAKNSVLSLSTWAPPATARIPAPACGEAVARLDACYIKSDGFTWRASGAALNAAARFRGLAATPCAVGESVTLFQGCAVNYGSGLTPGQDIYLSATTGALDTAPSTGGTVPIGFALDASRIWIYAIN